MLADLSVVGAYLKKQQENENTKALITGATTITTLTIALIMACMGCMEWVCMACMAWACMIFMTFMMACMDST